METKELKEFYNKHPKALRTAYVQQRHNAESRGIRWDFTFLEWVSVWYESGKWNDRGNAKLQYCMGRYDDTGSYNKYNVEIITNSQNGRRLLSILNTPAEFQDRIPADLEVDF